MSSQFLIIPAGTLIKWQGLPFRLEADTIVLGSDENFSLAEQLEKHIQWATTGDCQSNQDDRLMTMIYGSK